MTASLSPETLYGTCSKEWGIRFILGKQLEKLELLVLTWPIQLNVDPSLQQPCHWF